MFSWLCLVWLGVELGGNVVHNGIWVLFVRDLFSELLWLLKKRRKQKFVLEMNEGLRTKKKNKGNRKQGPNRRSFQNY